MEEQKQNEEILVQKIEDMNYYEQDNLIIGRVKGSGDTTFKFNFITPTQKFTKIGEYIYYNASTEVGIQKVLCRVTEILPIRHYPEEMLANPQLDPQKIASTLSYETEGMEIYEIAAQIIGYYDNIMGFINPRQLPNPGDPVYLAKNEILSHTLFKRKVDENFGANVGSLINRPKNSVPVVLDVPEIASKHLAILAATGAGKSYTVGVALEEMMMAKNRGAVLVFDPHGEYRTFIGAENSSVFQHNDYQPKVKLLEKKDVTVRFSEMEFGELLHVMKSLSEKMQHTLYESINRVKSINSNYTSSDIINDLKDAKLQDKNIENTVDGILWRLSKYVVNRELISDTNHITLKELLRPGQISVVDLNEMEEIDQQLMASVLLNRILKSRIGFKNNAEGISEDDLLEYPVFIVLEEGHRFAPGEGSAPSKNILKTILSEGRKFGIGVLIVSQRPGKLDSDVLSQCMTQIIMKITNPVDQQNIRNSVESISEDIMSELPGLTPGQAVITGGAVNTPVLVNIRQRILKHGGEGFNACQEWTDYWKKIKERPTKAPVKIQEDESLY